MSDDLLATVVAAARRASDERERVRPSVEVEAAVARGRQPQGDRFRASLAAAGIRIIAECKRRSPSRGVLREAYDPVAIAMGYAAHGAAAISVLTEPTFFDGSLDHLRAVRQAVGVPLLRKDFIVTPYQVIEAAEAGADAVLLIVAALDDRELNELAALARRVGLATLVEVHDLNELDRAVVARADVIGVNSRNLKTLAVDQGVLDALGPLIPPGVIAVAESGLKTADDLCRLRAAGYHAFLMGERFMTVPDPGEALDTIRRAAEEALR
jgi:indole-3-glycerol phosphate synthase